MLGYPVNLIKCCLLSFSLPFPIYFATIYSPFTPNYSTFTPNYSAFTPNWKSQDYTPCYTCACLYCPPTVPSWFSYCGVYCRRKRRRRRKRKKQSVPVRPIDRVNMSSTNRDEAGAGLVDKYIVQLKRCIYSVV